MKKSYPSFLSNVLRPPALLASAALAFSLALAGCERNPARIADPTPDKFRVVLLMSGRESDSGQYLRGTCPADPGGMADAMERTRKLPTGEKPFLLIYQREDGKVFGSTDADVLMRVFAQGQKWNPVDAGQEISRWQRADGAMMIEAMRGMDSGGSWKDGRPHVPDNLPAWNQIQVRWLSPDQPTDQHDLAPGHFWHI